MKVLIFNSLYYPDILGGAEISVQILAEGLQRLNVEPVVVSTAKHDKVSYVNGIKVYYMKVPNLYWVKEAKRQKRVKKIFWHLLNIVNPFIKGKLMHILYTEVPNVVHTNNLGGFSVYVWKFFKENKLPIVHTLRDYNLLCISATMFRKGRVCKNQCIDCKIMSYFKKVYSNKYVDAVVGISNFILEKHLRFNYFKNVEIKTVIPNPVDFQRDKVEKKARTDEEILLGFVGTLSKHKGIDKLLYLFSKANLRNFKLYIYGKGETIEYENFLRRKFSSKKILFKGFKKPEEIFKEIDILIVPSVWDEPFGRVVIEANFFGIPVIASNVGGLSELIEEGKNGFIFNLDDENSFYSAIVKAVEMIKKRTYSFEGVKKYNPNLIARKYMELYEYFLR